jgi:hypothetical protein
MDDNFLSLENAIIEHLRTAVPALQQVAGYNDLDKNLFTEVRKSPAAFVLFDGVDRPQDQKAGLSLIEKRWGIVLAVRGSNDKAATRATLGELITQAMRALDRYKPEGSKGPGLRLLAGPEPRYFDGGHAAAILIYGQREIAPIALG